MSRDAYNPTVAARTRLAEFIKNNPELLAEFEALGGLVADLDVIIAQGHGAKLANAGQSVATGEQAGAVADTEGAFATLQREYKKVMAVVRVVHDDLEDGGAPAEVLEPIARIIADETAVHIKTVPGEGDRRVKKALKSESQEAIRAEIEKDAGALLGNAHLADGLATRKVSVDRLTKLRDDASALSGRLATRTSKKGERQAATAVENAAVKAQSRKWGSVQRLIAAIDDARVEAQLSATVTK